MEKGYTQTNKNLSAIKRFAKIVSFLFDGSVLVLPIFLSVFFAGKDGLMETLPSFFISVVFIALIPYLFILYLYKSKKICDLQMPKKKERIIPLIFTNLSIFAGFIILNFTLSTRLLDTVYMIYFIVLPVLSIITLFWKISFHTSYVTIFSIVFVTIYGKWALFTIILIPLLIWARIELKRHTVAQAVSGVVVTGFISTLVLGLNGFTMRSHPSFMEIAEIFKPFTGYMYFNAANTISMMLYVFIILLACKIYLIRKISAFWVN